MAVYAIQAGAGGPIKIGIAADPNKRLQNLQTASYTKLQLIAAFEGGRREERALHERFAAHRLEGEWFSVDAETVLAAIDLPSIQLKQKQRKASLTKLDEWRCGKGLTVVQLAALLGVGGQNPTRTAHRYLTGERTPDRAMMRVIAKATGGKVTDDDFPIRPMKRAIADQRVPA